VYLFSFQVSTYTQKSETAESVLASKSSCTAGCLRAEISEGMCVHLILNILCLSIFNRHIDNFDCAKRFPQDLPTVRSDYIQTLYTGFCMKMNLLFYQGKNKLNIYISKD
jgi:hypothetical protein